MSSSTRMLERRVSNNRSELNADQRLNYLITWFISWSELQRDDFSLILARAGHNTEMNGHSHEESSGESSDEKQSNRKKMSLFDCQTKLFREWYAGLSDDQKHYLVLRLREVDADFGDKYERRAANIAAGNPDNEDDWTMVEKDYFEPGIPDHLIRKPSIVHSDDENNKLDNHGLGKVDNVVASPAKVIEEEEEEEDSNDLKEDEQLKDKGLLSGKELTDSTSTLELPNVA